MKRIFVQALAGGALAALSMSAQATTIIATFNSMTRQLRDLIGSLENRVRLFRELMGGGAGATAAGMP